METTLYIYLALYIMTLIGMSLFLSRREGKEGFLIANRNRKWWAIAASKFAGAIGIGYFIAYTGYGYTYGLDVYLLLMGTTVGYTLFGLWASPRLYKKSKKEKFYTQGDYVYSCTQSNVCKKLTNHVANLVLFGWLITSVIGGAKAVTHFGLMPYELALCLTILCVITYVSISGFKAVLATDIVQSIIILLLMGIITYTITHDIGFAEIIKTQTGDVELTTGLGFFLFGVLAVFSMSNYYQLVYAAKNAKAAKLGITLSIIPIILVATLLLMLGLYMLAHKPNLDPDIVFIAALQDYLPKSLMPFGLVLFFAGVMSSADTNIYAISTHYVLNKKTKKPVRDIRATIAILGILSAIIGYFFRDIVEVTILTAATSLLLSIPMIYILAGGTKSSRFIGSVIGAFLGLGVGLAIVGIEPKIVLPILLGSLIGLGYKGQFNERNHNVS